MAEYKLRHPYDRTPYKEKYDSLQKCRAAALRKIKSKYPSEGKHFVELDVISNGHIIGEINYGLKYRGWTKKSIAHLPANDQKNMLVLFDNYYTTSYGKTELLYKLNWDGSLGQKYKITAKGYEKYR